MSEINISILMPVYNSEKYLENTVRDIINQSYKQWELILVDDGSVDKSKDICEKLQKEDTRIKFIKKKNTGVSSTRNTALAYANGKYISFIDSDDSVHKDYLNTLITSMKKSQGELAICGFVERKILKIGQIHDNIKVFYPKELMAIEDMKDMIMDFGNSGLLNPLWNKIYSREIIEKNNIQFKEDIETGEDLIFNLQYFRKIKNICFSKEPLYYYMRRNNNSITYQYVDNMYEKGVEIHELLDDFLKEMDFYTSKNKDIIYGNHLMLVLSSCLNLFHKDCTLSFKEKRNYINKILNKQYVIECSKNAKKEKKIIRLTSILVKTKNPTLICGVFKGIALIRKVRA